MNSPSQAWRVFYDSVNFYARQTPERVAGMMKTQLELQPEEAAAVMTLGRSFVADFDRIESDAKSEVQRRYRSSVQPPAGKPTRGQSAPASAPITRRPGKTLRDMAVEDGLYAQVEEKRSAALAAHLRALDQAIGVDKRLRIGRFVETSVAPHVRTFVVGSPAPGIDRASSGGAYVPRSLTER